MLSFLAVRLHTIKLVLGLRSGEAWSGSSLAGEGLGESHCAVWVRGVRVPITNMEASPQPLGSQIQQKRETCFPCALRRHFLGHKEGKQRLPESLWGTVDICYVSVDICYILASCQNVLYFSIYLSPLNVFWGPFLSIHLDHMFAPSSILYSRAEN